MKDLAFAYGSGVELSPARLLCFIDVNKLLIGTETFKRQERERRLKYLHSSLGNIREELSISQNSG